MRAMITVAGVALALVACGGKGGDQPAADTTASFQPAAPAATGATHEVAMDFDGKVGTFTPTELTIKSGDVVNFVVKSGPPHNVAFVPDSIPAGAAALMNLRMTETMAPLVGPMKIGIGESYSISFEGAPAGEYRYFCTPHVPFGMHGKIIVQ